MRDSHDSESRDLRPEIAKSLSFVVQHEAHRILSEEQLQGDPDLLAAGWERRFIADSRRAKEAEQLYRDLGFEVLTEPVSPAEIKDDCADCQLLMALEFRTIYTRKRREDERHEGHERA
jgi:hypothetical protein